MTRTSKPSRRKIKQAVQHVARLTGVFLDVVKPLMKDKAFIRDVDHFAKANRCYPVSIDGQSYFPEAGKPVAFTFEFQGSTQDTQSTISKVKDLVREPRPMIPLSGRELDEVQANVRKLFENSPTAIEGLDVETVKKDVTAFIKEWCDKVRPNVVVFTTPGRKAEPGWSWPISVLLPEQQPSKLTLHHSKKRTEDNSGFYWDPDLKLDNIDIIDETANHEKPKEP